MVQSSSISQSPALSASAASTWFEPIKLFLIRRRILLSGILFSMLIGHDVVYGPKPHDLANLRDPFSVGGVLLVFGGLALRSWAAGILRKDKELTTTGPYRLIRNPLYVGSFLMVFGFCALIGDFENLVLLAGPLLVLYAVKVRQEERLLARLFPDEWATYVRSTPRFVPRPARTNLSSPWRLAQWMSSREYQAVGATALALVAIKVWQAMQPRRFFWPSAGQHRSMRLFTRYVLREIFQVFLVTLVALTSLMVLIGAVREAIVQGLGMLQIVQLLPYLLPNALMFAVPGTILFSVSTVYGRMSGANEVVALKSLGIHPWAILYPTLILSIVLSLTTVWLNDLAMSWGTRGMQRVVIDSLEDIAYGMLRAHRHFQTPQFSVTVQRVVGHTLVEPLFTLPTADNAGRITIHAQRAELRSNTGSGVLTLVLFNGNADGPDFHIEFPNQQWEKDIDLRPKGNGLGSPAQLALAEIPGRLAEQNESIERQEQRMIAQAGFQMICGDFDGLTSGAWLGDADSLQNQYYRKFRMQTEPPRRWANGFSCLCFTLVGATMAIRRKNSDALTSFFLCFLPILLVYYPFLFFGADRAKAGAINPYVVWLANAVLAAWGLWLLERVIRY